VAVLGVPDDRQAVADQPEQDGALDRAADAVAGLANAGVLAGLAEAHLHLPAGRVPFDQLGEGGAARSAVTRARSKLSGA
jgi:hypothetical protein